MVQPKARSGRAGKEPVESYEQISRQYAAAMDQHDRFRLRIRLYREASQRHLAAIAAINLHVVHLRITAGDGPAVGPQVDEWEDVRQARREADIIRSDLFHEFKDLAAEFADLKQPENDVVDLQRQMLALRPPHVSPVHLPAM